MTFSRAIPLPKYEDVVAKTQINLFQNPLQTRTDVTEFVRSILKKDLKTAGRWVQRMIDDEYILIVTAPEHLVRRSGRGRTPVFIIANPDQRLDEWKDDEPLDYRELEQEMLEDFEGDGWK